MADNINKTVVPNKSFYYGDEFKSWINQPTSYALDISLENFFSDVLKFPLDRIIYASNDWCIRERERRNEGNLNMPFMNYYRTGYSDCERELFNHKANKNGLLDVSNQSYIAKLGTKLKIAPVRTNYEATIFFSQQKDCEYAYHNLLYEASNETILYPELETVGGDTLLNMAIVDLDIEFEPNYVEEDWIQQNKIHSIALDIGVDTFQIYGNTNIHIADEIMFDFLVEKYGNKVDINKLKNSLNEYLEDYFVIYE